ncbi:MAG: UvrD-helicase domain-containing protein, partial [Pseudomonadota bacterium]
MSDEVRADGLVISQALRDSQGMASNPELSAWVSANAGAGKTYVLTRRVTRLLLGGTDPARILCLTYTKAAAANMANRVFGDLEAWAKADDAALRNALSPFIHRPGADDLARARRLFARAIETPGGLKVQTIHAFCEGLLQAFPFEANVPASFQVMDEVQTRDMLARARDAVMARADTQADAFSEALQALAMERAPGSLAEHLDAAVAVRRKLAGWLASPDPSGRLNDGLGLDAEHSRDALFAGLETSPALPVSLWGEAALVLAAGSKSAQSLAVDLQTALAAEGDARVAAYLDVFLTKTNRTVRSRLLTKDFRERHPDWADRLDGEAQRSARLHGRLNALTLAERSQALFTLAGGIIAVFEREKQRRGLMEFQDLIDHAAALLAPEGNRW